MYRPTPGRYALDTNVVIAILNGEPEAVRRWSQEEEVLLPAPVLGELLYGARRSGAPERNEERVRQFARSTRLVSCDEAVCTAYAGVKAVLAAQGRPIPDNDVWIAACCVAAEATLASRDPHFDAVDGLERDAWS